MKLLYTEQQFIQARGKEELPLKCYCCSKTFYLSKKRIKDCLNPKENRQGKYCSPKCQSDSTIKYSILNCLVCKKEFKKTQSEIKKTVSGNHFCSKSCSATYNNTHKTTGTRRSKLEKYLEEQLITLYPNLSIDFNKKDTINSELDIYIPSLKLAFELNGIYHYEPIHGQCKLSQTQNNDQRKFQACAENGISLCIIDTSKQKYFKESTSQEFLNIIINIINNKSKN